MEGGGGRHCKFSSPKAQIFLRRTLFTNCISVSIKPWVHIISGYTKAERNSKTQKCDMQQAPYSESTHIRSLRQKIQSPHDSWRLTTVYPCIKPQINTVTRITANINIKQCITYSLCGLISETSCTITITKTHHLSCRYYNCFIYPRQKEQFWNDILTPWNQNETLNPPLFSPFLTFPWNYTILLQISYELFQCCRSAAARLLRLWGHGCLLCVVR